MCEVWKNSTKPSEEIELDVIEKLPEMFFTNITGGEPFVRQDLQEIVEILRKKSKRIFISTNGFLLSGLFLFVKNFLIYVFVLVLKA